MKTPMMHLVEIDAIASSEVVECQAEAVERLAGMILKVGGLAAPLQVRSNGFKDGMPVYLLVSGFEFQLQAVKRARELNREMQVIGAWIDVDFCEQNEVITQASIVKPKQQQAHPVSSSKPTRARVQEEVNKWRANPGQFTREQSKALARLAQTI